MSIKQNNRNLIYPSQPALPVASGLLLAGLVSVVAQAQQYAPPLSPASIRYAPGYQVRALPSEERLAARNVGLLPSEHRNYSFLSGTLPSQGPCTYLIAPSVPLARASQVSSAYGAARYQGSGAFYNTGLARNSLASVRPYRPALASQYPRAGSLIGGNSLLRPLPGTTNGSIRYPGIR
jgi:hypothetical protein